MAPKNKGNDSQFTLRLPSDLKRDIEKKADEKGLSLNDFIVSLISSYLNGMYETLKTRIEKYEATISNLKEQNKGKDNEIFELKCKVTSLNEDMEKQKKDYDKLRGLKENSDKTIASLQDKVLRYSNIDERVSKIEEYLSLVIAGSENQGGKKR